MSEEKPSHHSGQFKKGQEAWNKKGKGKGYKRLTARLNGKVIPNSNKVWLLHNKLDKIPEGFVIHHKDENPLNDVISNLKLMRKEDHSYIHNILDRERFLTMEKVRRLKEWINKTYDVPIPQYVLDEIFGEKLSK